MARNLSSTYTGTPITIRLSEEDDKIVRQEMKRRNIASGRSEFLRQLIRETQDKQPVTVDVLRRELKRHGLKVKRNA
jgi:Arc/MetJ-type ribon-helix-helix transcriptional regulator